MFCIKCGKQIDNNSSFCEHCGEKQGIQENTLVPTSSTNIIENTQSQLLNTATQGQRFINYLIDSIAYLFIALLMGFIIGFVMGMLNVGDYLDHPSADLYAQLLSYVLMFFFYFLWENHTQKTPGKYVTKTRTVTKDGLRPDTRTILIRTLCRFIPFDNLSFLIGKNPIGWHDRLSKTIVIKEEN
jgi:uncharacterized RDD family membrane protein YckC